MLYVNLQFMKRGLKRFTLTKIREMNLRFHHWEVGRGGEQKHVHQLCKFIRLGKSKCMKQRIRLAHAMECFRQAAIIKGHIACTRDNTASSAYVNEEVAKNAVE